MRLHDVTFDKWRIAEFCRRHGVARLSLFGSILTTRFADGSDIDFLVEFLPGRQVDLFYVGGILVELQENYVREVDIRTPGELSPYLRKEVIRGARLLYAA